MMRHEQLRDHFLGTTLGLAVGDALGSPLRYMNRYQIEGRHGLVKEMLPRSDGAAPGTGSDETEQLLLALDSAIRNRGFDGIDTTLRLIRWMESKSEPIATEVLQVLSELKENPERWQTAAREAWYENSGVTATNGSLSRGTVAALTHWQDLPAMIEHTIRLAQLTHFDPRCVDASLAINFMIAQCVAGQFDKHLLNRCWQFIDGLKEDPEYKRLALNYEQHILDTKANVTPLPSFDDDYDAVPRALRHIKTMEYDDLGCSSYVVHTMQTGIWLLMNSENFEEGVSRAVSLGGDCNVQGAVTGALLGARFGLRSVPGQWIAAAHHRSQIVSLSEILLGRSEVPTT